MASRCYAMKEGCASVLMSGSPTPIPSDRDLPAAQVAVGSVRVGGLTAAVSLDPLFNLYCDENQCRDPKCHRKLYGAQWLGCEHLVERRDVDHGELQGDRQADGCG
jgi:hypothetical protein